jgi:CRISPR-associated protein Cmr4
MKTNLLFLHALSPLHAGTGHGVGAIDLPIAREKATNLPIVPGSSIKGVLRANCEDDTLKTKVFGPETNAASDHAGSAQFSDLRLLFLPVRSLSGTFAWVTSPLVLQRYQRDCGMANKLTFGKVPQVPNEETCLLAADPSSLTMTIDKEEKQVVLEDLRLTGTFNKGTTAKVNKDLQDVISGIQTHLFTDKTWQDTFASRVCVVHDNVLAFLLETATEVTARIQLEQERKTVKDSALWYEEALPAESILAGLMTVQEVKANAGEVEQVIKAIKNPIQVGGNSTVGRGLCNLHLVVGG